MSGIFRRIDIFEPPPSLFSFETTIFRPNTLDFSFFSEEPELAYPLDLFNPNCNLFDLHYSPFEVFDTITDLIQIEKTPFSSSYRRVQHRSGSGSYFQSVCDRVVGEDRKYKWTAEIKGGKREVGVKKYDKWTAEIKCKGKDVPPILHGVKIKDTDASAALDCCCGAGKIGTKKGSSATRTVEIVEPVHQGAVVVRQAFAKRAGAIAKVKGRRKVLSPEEAALMIQMSFRAYLIRRSQALRSLRELAVAKAKLKEIRALFNNFSYRRLIARDAEERQRFSERIIVLLLTVDAIEGVELMVRAARRSMVDELEAMLDVVDPKPPGRLGSMKRRAFDLPEGGIQNEIAAGMAGVVQMLDRAQKYDTDTFEICL